MDPRDLEDTAAGRCVKAREVGLGEYWAFIPNPLPPQIEYDQTLSQYLSEADRMLGNWSNWGHIFIYQLSLDTTIALSPIKVLLRSLEQDEQ